jgi:hypothetical protein
MRAALVGAALITLAGCGSSDKTATTTAATATATKTVAGPAEPSGKLSPQEYAQAKAALGQLAKIERTHNLSRAVVMSLPACRRLRVKTALLTALRANCVQVFRAVHAVAELERQTPTCTRDARAGDISCFSNLFRSIGRSTRASVVRSAQMNRELRRRRIRGACARALGSTSAQQANTRAITHDALSAAHALEARDDAAFRRAATRLDSDFTSPGSTQTFAIALRQLRACD